MRTLPKFSHAMDDKTFDTLSGAAFARIRSGLEQAGLDYDTPADGVLEIEFDDGAKIVVNRHAAAQEIWVAARSGGFHFRPAETGWKGTRDGADLYVKLARLIAAQGGVTPLF